MPWSKNPRPNEQHGAPGLCRAQKQTNHHQGFSAWGVFFFSPSPFRNLSQSLHWLKLENSLSWGYLAKHQARQFPSYAVVTTSAAHFNLYAFHG